MFSTTTRRSLSVTLKQDPTPILHRVVGIFRNTVDDILVYSLLSPVVSSQSLCNHPVIRCPKTPFDLLRPCFKVDPDEDWAESLGKK